MEDSSLKRQIVEKAVKQILEEAKVPHGVYMKALSTLSAQIKEHKEERKEWQQILTDVRDEVTTMISQHGLILDDWDRNLNEFILRDWSGAPGKDAVGAPGPAGKDADHEFIISEVMKRIVIPEVKDGEPGKDATVDEDKIITSILSLIQEKKLIKASHIAGLQGWVKDGVKYRFEELMHGGGSSSGAVSLTIVAVTGTVDNTNVTFTVTQTPTLLNINGAFYQQTGGAITWSIAGTTITLSAAVGTGGQIFGVL